MISTFSHKLYFIGKSKFQCSIIWYLFDVLLHFVFVVKWMVICFISDYNLNLSLPYNMHILHRLTKRLKNWIFF